MNLSLAQTLPSAKVSALGRRLRLAAFGVVTLILTLIISLETSGRPIFPYLFGEDLIPSYMAGTFIREGRTDLLTDFPAAQKFQTHLRRVEGMELHGRTGPWLNPPYYGFLFVPLSMLPYRAALWTWFGLNLVMLTGSIGLLYRMLPADRRRGMDLAVIAALVLFSMPSLQALACQQNTFISLLLLCVATTLWRADRAVLAGAVAGLLAFKPQLALIFWAAMAMTLGRRAVFGIACTVAALGIATLVLLPGTITDYATKLTAILPSLRTDRPYAWERQITFTGFWRLLIQGRIGGPAASGITPMVMLGIGALGLVLFWQMFRAVLTGQIPHARIIAATIVSMPLLMPYFMDYDLMLLAVPATLLAAERMARGRPDSTWQSKLLLANWGALFGWLYLNAEFADTTGVSVSVLLTATLAAGMIGWLRSARFNGDVEMTDTAGTSPGQFSETTKIAA